MSPWGTITKIPMSESYQGSGIPLFSHRGPIRSSLPSREERKPSSSSPEMERKNDDTQRMQRGGNRYHTNAGCY